MSVKVNGDTYIPKGIKAIVNKNGTYYGKYPFQYETELVMARAIKEGFTLPSTYIQVGYDNFIKSLKTSGIWAKSDAGFLSILNDTSLMGLAKINFIKPFNALAATSGTLSYTTKGWIGNGLNGYVNTGVNPSVGTNKYTLNNAGRHVLVYQECTSLGTSYIDGNLSQSHHLRNISQVQQRITSNGNLNATADMSGTGLKSINRDNANDVRLYNKDIEIVRTLTSVSVPTSEFLIGRSNTLYGDAGVGFELITSSLSNTEVQNLRTYLNTFIQYIGLTPIA